MRVDGRLYRWVETGEEYDEKEIIIVMDEDEMNDILSLQVGQKYYDEFGESWERLR